MEYLRERWTSDGGYREFLVIALPLTLSMASWSIQHFVDRVFLTWYSTEALAAALPAGMTNFIIASLFIGVVSYVNTFIAQYVGARRPERVGPALWQGVYLSLVGGIAGLGFAALASPIFDLVGHDQIIREYEVGYFRVLCYGFFPLILSTAAACFYSGRGQTWTILAVNAASTGFNIVLDYGLIFGHWGLPAWGIRGAAWATNASAAFSAILFCFLLIQHSYRVEFATLSGWRFDRALFTRLLRFGGPNGLNFMLDILAFTFFILVVGKLGTLELTATNIAFNINSLAFMPLIGAGIAVSTMVGQRLGRDQPEEAAYCTWTGLHVALAYMTVMVLAYVLVPELFLLPYAVGAEGADFEEARDLAVLLLRMVAIYCLFDALYLIFSAALKGAGDTRFILYISAILGWAIMVIPAMIAHTFYDAGIFVLWAFLCLYVIVVSLVFYYRFRAGRWKTMRVIEESPENSPPDTLPE